MKEKNKTLSLLDLKGKISFADGYDYRSFRVLKIDVFKSCKKSLMNFIRIRI